MSTDILALILLDAAVHLSTTSPELFLRNDSVCKPSALIYSYPMILSEHCLPYLQQQAFVNYITQL